MIQTEAEILQDLRPLSLAKGSLVFTAALIDSALPTDLYWNL